MVFDDHGVRATERDEVEASVASAEFIACRKRDSSRGEGLAADTVDPPGTGMGELSSLEAQHA